MRWFALSSFALLSVSACSGTDSITGAKGPEPTQLTRVDLGTLGGASSYATGINSSDVVVGWSQTTSGATHAFRWSTAEGMVDLGTLPGDETSQAVAVLDAPLPDGGQILGVSGSDGKWTPVVWSMSGSRRVLSAPLIPGFTIALPSGFNSRGDVIGSDAGGPGVQHAWVWSEAAGKYDLSANFSGGSRGGSATGITSAGLVLITAQVDACANNAQCSRSFLWSKNSGYRAVGTPSGESDVSVAGLALNESGMVAGWLSTGTAAAVPYRWSATGGFTMLTNYTTASERYGYVAAVSANGTAVGGDFDPASRSIVASRWSGDGTITKLSPYDLNPSIAVAINEQGTIAGWKVITGGMSHAVIWQIGPQSSTILAPSMSMTVDRNTRSARFTRSAECLSRTASISSRQALFSCVMESDR